MAIEEFAEKHVTRDEFLATLKQKYVGQTITDVVFSQTNEPFAGGAAFTGPNTACTHTLQFIMSGGATLSVEVGWATDFFEDISVEVDGTNMLFEGSRYPTERK